MSRGTCAWGPTQVRAGHHMWGCTTYWLPSGCQCIGSTKCSARPHCPSPSRCMLVWLAAVSTAPVSSPPIATCSDGPRLPGHSVHGGLCDLGGHLQDQAQGAALQRQAGEQGEEQGRAVLSLLQPALPLQHCVLMLLSRAAAVAMQGSWLACRADAKPVHACFTDPGTPAHGSLSRPTSCRTTSSCFKGRPQPEPVCCARMSPWPPLRRRLASCCLHPSLYHPCSGSALAPAPFLHACWSPALRCCSAPLLLTRIPLTYQLPLSLTICPSFGLNLRGMTPHTQRAWLAL